MVSGMKLERICLISLPAVAAIVAGMVVGGCGGNGGDSSAPSAAGAAKTTSAHGGGEYEEVLAEMHDTAVAGGSYDGYGFAEYMPSTQRAAIEAFCFVADRIAKFQSDSTVAAASVHARIVRKAEADLKSERGIVAPAPAHRAIAKLLAVLGVETLDPALAGRYVHACYR
jgi:hypothetical protein